MILSKMTIKDVGYAKKKMHTQRRYATCSKGMLEKKIKKERCIPKEDKPHAHKECKKKKKDSPHSWKIKKRDGSCKGVHPPSTKKKSHTLAHLDQIV